MGWYAKANQIGALSVFDSMFFMAHSSLNMRQTSRRRGSADVVCWGDTIRAKANDMHGMSQLVVVSAGKVFRCLLGEVQKFNQIV